ncbi:MAG: SymE family type I addiction module toxin [Chitinophagaceae bacterium]|nr:SymE family type I addiction module toxin [Chitinophagaceae bacterium]
MQAKPTRKLRLCRKYRNLRNNWQPQVVPWLALSGLWLQDAGFKPGDRVEITIDNNLLIIKNCGRNGDH